MPNFAEQVVQRLEDLGVKRIYGLVGDSLNPLSDAVRQSDIEWVHVRNEEAAAFAAKMGTGNTAGAGSWRDSFGLFGRRGDQTPHSPAEDRRVGKLERGALADLDLEPGADKAAIKARYHEMLKRFHPDTNGGDRGAEAKLQRVIKAWKTLKKAGLA